jgi:hypothetical protein
VLRCTVSTRYMMAEALAQYLADVRPRFGYGQSSKPPTAPNHAPTPSARWPASTCISCKALGHQHFCAAGHDRGLYVAWDPRTTWDIYVSLRRQSPNAQRIFVPAEGVVTRATYHGEQTKCAGIV